MLPNNTTANLYFDLPKEYLEALEYAKSEPDSIKNRERGRTKFGDDAINFAFEQQSLRKKAIQKFKFGEKMVFNRESLEQASHEEVAEFHASRFPQNELVVDVSCGIGGDLIALAKRGPTIGVDLDIDRLRFANHNLRVHKLGADIRNLDCFQMEWNFDYAFADPARRVDKIRTLDPNLFSPSVQELIHRMQKLKLGGIKLSPLLPDSFLKQLVTDGGEIEFVSHDGECKEVVIWVGLCAGNGTWAHQVEPGLKLVSSEKLLKVTFEPLTYIFEADPAAIRGHCLADFEMAQLGSKSGYLTSDELKLSPWLRTYKLISEIFSDFKKLKTYLRTQDVGKVVVKSRISGFDANELSRELGKGLLGETEAIVLGYSDGLSRRFIIISPVE